MGRLYARDQPPFYPVIFSCDDNHCYKIIEALMG